MLGFAPISATPIMGLPTATTTTATYTVPHDEKAVNVRSRRHEQMVADMLNNLLRTGEVTGGIPSQAALGFRPSDPSDLQPDPDNRETIPLAEILDRICSALATLGQKP